MKKFLIISTFSLLFLCSYSKTCYHGSGSNFISLATIAHSTQLVAKTIDEKITVSVQPEKETRTQGDLCIIVFKQCDPKH